MTDETTSEQLAEIEGQGDPVQVRAGRWRTRGGQEFGVSAMPTDHEDFSAAYPWWDGNVTTWRTDGRFSVHENAMDLLTYLGPVEPQPQPQPEPEDKTQELPEYTPPYGWRVLAVGEVLRDGDVTVRRDGYQYPTERVGGWVGFNQRYIRPIEQQPEPQPEPESDTELQAQVAFLKGREVTLGTRLQHEKEVTTRLRSELESAQVMIGESRQLVTSLRTINDAQEKAFNAANRDNTDLQHRLNTVAAEWAEQVETSRRLQAELAQVSKDRYALQVELDAAQQVPADSPELRQLRADLEQVTLGRDTYRDGYERVLSDLVTIRATTKAEAVEAIVEWLEPIRLADSAYLANATMQHLPSIMRSLVGLDSPEDVE